MSINDDFDEDTLENTELNSNEVIGPIAEERRKKEIESNTFVISRENFEKSSNEQIEAWFTKFDQVIIDDSKEPYKVPLTKKELAVKIGKVLYRNMNRSNMQKGIGMIQKGTSMISEFGKAFDTGQQTKTNNFRQSRKESDYSALTSKPKRNSLKIWSDEKKHQIKPKKRKNKKSKSVQKDNSNFLTGNKKITFSSKKVKFF